MDILGRGLRHCRPIPRRAPEFLFRHALPSGIYGGTMEVFRNMIAQHELGLGRPSYGR